MNLKERVLAPTPKFFQVVRNAGALLASVGGLILSLPVDPTTSIATIANYLVIAGAVAAAVSQTAVATDGGETDARTSNGGGSGAGDVIK